MNTLIASRAETLVDPVAKAIVANLEHQTRVPGSASASALAANSSTITGSHWSMVLTHELWALEEINAVYVDDTESGSPSVYCVVPEHDSAKYDDLLAAEDAVRKALPGMDFIFRVRAHQGREPRCAVPPSARVLFTRR